MSDLVFNAFLERQHKEGTALAASSDFLTLVPFSGVPPTHYIAEFSSKGIIKRGDEIVEHAHWAVGICFPPDYLRRPVDVAQVLTYLGSAREPWHPNIRPPFVCMHLSPGAPLAEILYGLHDLLTWNLYSTSDEGLNHAAAQWARNQGPDRFPIDRRPLKRRAVALAVRPHEAEAGV